MTAWGGPAVAILFRMARPATAHPIMKTANAEQKIANAAAIHWPMEAVGDLAPRRRRWLAPTWLHR